MVTIASWVRGRSKLYFFLGGVGTGMGDGDTCSLGPFLGSGAVEEGQYIYEDGIYHIIQQD